MAKISVFSELAGKRVTLELLNQAQISRTGELSQLFDFLSLIAKSALPEIIIA
jgi:hypothetical protein